MTYRFEPMEPWDGDLRPGPALPAMQVPETEWRAVSEPVARRWMIHDADGTPLWEVRASGQPLVEGGGYTVTEVTE